MKFFLSIVLSCTLISCRLNKTNNLSTVNSYSDTTAVSGFIYRELKSYMEEVDSFPKYHYSSSACVIIINQSTLDITFLYPMRQYLGDGYYKDSLFRFVGCFYKDTVLIAIYDRNDGKYKTNYYDTTKLDRDIHKYLFPDSLFPPNVVFGTIGPKWSYKMIHDSLFLINKRNRWIKLQ